jgi:hypothetical protein
MVWRATLKISIKKKDGVRYVMMNQTPGNAPLLRARKHGSHHTRRYNTPIIKRAGDVL